MTKQVFDLFKIKIDFDLGLMKENQNLFDLTSKSILKIKEILQKVNPGLLLVQGDTTTAFTASLAAFYSHTKIGHIEAGLRSFNKYHPFPEEVNRRFISLLADFHFAPTEAAASNLINEGIPESKIFITGNTVIDSLFEAKKRIENSLASKKIEKNLSVHLPKDFYNKKFVLVTLHRREKFGIELENLLNSLKNISKDFDYYFVYPVHLNPNVQKPVKKILSGNTNFILLPPLDYLSFLYLMSKCHFIITDSGGIQEECFVFEKFVIVIREVTERSEAIEAGYAFLTGSDEEKIRRSIYDINKKLEEGIRIFPQRNPFGDGFAAKKIVEIIRQMPDEI